MKQKIVVLLLCTCIFTGCGKQNDSFEPVMILSEEPEQVSPNIIEETPVSQEVASEPELPTPETVSKSGVNPEPATETEEPDNTPVSPSADSVPEEESLPESEEEMNSERVTYQDGFYYEPLSDNVKARITGLSYPSDCPVPYDDLRYISVLYCDFNNTVQTGEIICNQSIAQDIVEIFYELYQASYPIEKIRLIDEYNADDDLSCQDNNTSSFCYRTVAGSKKLSKHAQGLAIDINPFYNPYITYPNGVPTIKLQDTAVYADRSADFIAKIDHNDLAYKLFTAHGFTWGGDWNTVKYYQHFQK